MCATEGIRMSNNFDATGFLVASEIGGACRDRTYDQSVKSRMLYL